MIVGVDQGEWRVTDNFGDQWRIAFVDLPAQRPDQSPSLPTGARAPVEQLVFDGFDDDGAIDDRIASVLLEVYDALTNERLSSRLDRPTDDRDRLLRGFRRSLRDTLLDAVAADVIRVERVEPGPWPFTDEAEEAAAADDAGAVSEVTTWIGLCLVDQAGKPVGRRRYRITLPDGSVSEGTLASDGTARVEGIGTPGTCKIDFLEFDKVDWGPQTLLPGGTVPGATGPVVPADPEPPPAAPDTPPPSTPSPTPAPAPPPSEPDDTTFIAFEMVDPSGQPLGGRRFRVVLPDGSSQEGAFDAAGAARLDGISPGEVQLTLLDIEADLAPAS